MNLFTVEVRAYSADWLTVHAAENLSDAVTTATAVAVGIHAVAQNKNDTPWVRVSRHGEIIWRYGTGFLPSK